MYAVRRATPQEKRKELDDEVWEYMTGIVERRRDREAGHQGVMPDAIRPILLHGGTTSIAWYNAWRVNDYRSTEAFGIPFLELPKWLGDDLLTLDYDHRWHDRNYDLKPAPLYGNEDTGLPLD